MPRTFDAAPFAQERECGNRPVYPEGVLSQSPALPARAVDALREYIDNQEEHHRRVTFQDELRRLLTKYGLEWDERYVWD
jgi:hypothetical protein